MAAVDAVIRFRGAHGLDLYIKEGLQHPGLGMDAAEAAQKIIGRSFDESDREEKLLDWWNGEGARFVSGVKGR